MKFSEHWLREWANPDLDSNALVEQITMAGLEVDEVVPVASQFDQVVVGEVLGVESHPNADKLSVCRVSDGEQEFQVVCGAKNVRQGLKVAFAKVGACIGEDFKIKKAKLRSVESLGMLCSEKELGLSDSHDGIMELAAEAPVGDSIRDYLKLDDVSIDVDLTPNRSDCLSILGMAREVATLNLIPFETPVFKSVEPKVDDQFEIVVEAKKECPRYVGRVIKGVNLAAETPIWMKEKLRRSGIRSIDPVVDVTNFVMLELGQPMHAFDLDALSEKIVVRKAHEDEKITLLDGQEIELNTNTLMITDAKGPLAIAGVMGGLNSGVDREKTQNILLESAYFDPVTLAGEARSYGLHTDSSHRFERGVDFMEQERAVERATELLMEIVGGQPGPIIEKVSQEHLPTKELVKLRHERLQSLLGIEIGKTEVEEILARLGLCVDKMQKDGWLIKVPSYRFDIEVEVDLIEEVGRVYGYNNLPVTEPIGSLGMRPSREEITPLNRLKSFLTDRGFQEVVTYSFVDPKLQNAMLPEFTSIPLANPISSELSVMRTSLWPGLLNTVQYNQNRQQQRLRVFESGLKFYDVDGTTVQEQVLSGLISGNRYPEGWASSGEEVTFYDLKGDLEQMFELLRVSYSFEASQHSALHPGQTAEIKVNGEKAGFIGSLHPKIHKMLNLNGPVFLFELSLPLVVQGKLPTFKEFSRFPEVRRDLAIVVDVKTAYADIQEVIREAGGHCLVRHNMFDLYQGESLGTDKKSIAISLVWQDSERTLLDEEVATFFDRVLTELKQRFNALLRS